MKLSGFKPKPLDLQGLLWDESLLWRQPLAGHGHVRTVIGNLMEELTVRLIGGRRHKTDSTSDYCPDISVGPDYYECKAAGKTNQTFIYHGRVLKDKEFVDAGYTLYYIVWHHKAETKKAKTVDELETLVVETMRAVYKIPFLDIAMICGNRKLEALNSRYGPGGDTYGSGYRIPISLLAPHLYMSTEQIQTWLEPLRRQAEVARVGRSQHEHEG